MQSQINQIKSFLNSSKSLLIGAGAGIGVDSGLPDFRGQDGFWKAYPPLAKLGIRFEEMANPRWFHDDPHLAWGFMDIVLENTKVQFHMQDFRF